MQEYYEKVLMRWPKATLTKHDVVSYDRKEKVFTLAFDLADEATVAQAKRICEEKIAEWIQKKAERDELVDRLLDKLLEEHVELLGPESLDEVADMMEVLFAIAKQLGHSEEAVLVRRNAKRQERGGFDRALYLTQILPGPLPQKKRRAVEQTGAVRAARPPTTRTSRPPFSRPFPVDFPPAGPRMADG